MLITKLSISDSKNRADQISETGSFLLSLGKVESYFFYSKSLQYIKDFCIHVMQLQLVPTEIKQSGISYQKKEEEECVEEFSVQKCKCTHSCSDDAWEMGASGHKG